MPEPTRRAAALAGGAALAFLLSACAGGSGEAEREPDAAEGAEAVEDGAIDPKETVELVDPVELAPDNLCAVLSPDTLDEFVGPERSGDQEGESGVPDPDSLERTGRLSMTCLTVSVRIGGEEAPRSHSLTYRLEITEEPQMDDALPPIEESEADPSLDVGELATIEFAREGTSVKLTVVDGQALVKVTYDADEVVDDGAGDYVGVAYLDEEEMTRRAVTVAEEILAAVG